MNSMTLIWAALKRRKARSIFTWLSVAVAFLLFGILAAVRYGMLGQLTVSVAERLETNNKAQGSLPLSYYDKIVTVPGVTVATYLTGFNGYYKDPKNSFRVLAFSPTIFQVYAEAKLPPAQLQAWKADRQGVIVGPELAKRMGWKIGDAIPVQSKTLQKNGSTTWYFRLLGIYHADLPTAYQHFFIGHYEYFNEGVADPTAQNLVFQYIERIDDPRNTTRIANAIDGRFANASPQTLTQSEVQETVSFIRQFGNITAMVIYVGIAVFFSLLLIVGNTLAQSVRERTSEFAMLRAVGFGRGWIVVLVFQEALLLIVSGGIVGLFAGWLVTRALYPTVGNILRSFQMTWSAAGVGIILAIVIGILVSLVPMQRVVRLQVAEALRRG